ncbi:MAG: hypothetical protein GYB65_02155 [Chloroflexi bacterium]|nr:hypothetical protein [Chloroflexota bacterium]
MSEYIEIGDSTELNFNQKWNSYLALVLAVVMVFLGIALRNSATAATQTFEDLDAGVRAQVPQNWLLDDDGGSEFVFRAQDPGALPYKTTLQVSFLPVGPGATPRTVLDYLHLQRATQFSAYRQISRSNETLRDGTPASRMIYAYTQVEPNPYLESKPIVVQAVDVVSLRGTQAIVVTYREEQSRFDTNLYRFENLLNTLEIF